MLLASDVPVAHRSQPVAFHMDDPVKDVPATQLEQDNVPHSDFIPCR